MSDHVPPEEVARVLREQAPSVEEAKARLAAAKEAPAGPSVAERIAAIIKHLRSKVSVPKTPEDLARPLPDALFPHEAIEKKRKQQEELTKSNY